MLTERTILTEGVDKMCRATSTGEPPRPHRYTELRDVVPLSGIAALYCVHCGETIQVATRPKEK